MDCWIPALVRTPMWEYIDEAKTARTGPAGVSAISGMLGSIPVRRVEAPNDVPGAVSFPSSPDTADITGQFMVIDGGICFPSKQQ